MRARLVVALAALTCVGPAGATVDPDLLAMLRTRPEARVIVAFRDGPGPARNPAAVGAVRARVLARLGRRGFVAGPRWSSVAAMPGTATREAVRRLAADPEVARVGLDPGGRLADAESGALIGVPAAVAAGLTGRGVTVAVVDSGADRTHPDLSSSIVAEHCFVPPAGCPNGAAEQDGAGSARDDNGHGTNVTGIVVADGVVAPRGVAPDAAVVAVRVLDSANRFSGASQVISALDWLARTHPDVRVVNLSLGSDELFAGPCDNARSYTLAYASAVAALRARGATVFASSMNSGSAAGIGAPACVGAVEAVGAVYDTMLGAFVTPVCTDPATAPDAVACFSNGGPGLDLLAPGALVLSTAPAGGTSTYTGTSQASPHAAAAAAILLQAAPSLTPDAVGSLLRTTGRAVTDPRSGMITPRVDIPAALAALAQPPPPPAPPPPPPAVAVAPAQLRVGRVRVGRVASARLTVRNRGGLPLAVDATVAAPFTLAPPRRLTVAPGRSAILRVRFAPRRALPYRRALTLATNDPARRRVSVAVTGTGVRRR